MAMKDDKVASDAQIRVAVDGGPPVDASKGLTAFDDGLSGTKRKVPELGVPGRFKTIGTLVVAMQRFKASLNPTYTYGKRPESSLSSGSRPSSSLQTEEHDTGVTSLESTPRLHQRPTSSNGSRPSSAAERYAYSTRGHKAAYLLKPLPPAPGEEAAA